MNTKMKILVGVITLFSVVSLPGLVFGHFPATTGFRGSVGPRGVVFGNSLGFRGVTSFNSLNYSHFIPRYHTRPYFLGYTSSVLVPSYITPSYSSVITVPSYTMPSYSYATPSYVPQTTSVAPMPYSCSTDTGLIPVPQATGNYSSVETSTYSTLPNSTVPATTTPVCPEASFISSQVNAGQLSGPVITYLSSLPVQDRLTFLSRFASFDDAVYLHNRFLGVVPSDISRRVRSYIGSRPHLFFRGANRFHGRR
jgi:hypothetical protein